jgi:hypothetical protein
LENGFGPSRRAAGEEPDRGVVAVRGIVLLLRGFALHPGDELGIVVHHREGPEVLQHRLGVLELLPARRVDEGEGRARVVEEVFDLVTLEVRVQHHDDGADPEDAEEGAGELGPVLEGDDHPALGTWAYVRAPSSVRIAVRSPRPSSRRASRK